MCRYRLRKAIRAPLVIATEPKKCPRNRGKVELPRAAREGYALQGSAVLVADLVRKLLKAHP